MRNERPEQAGHRPETLDGLQGRVLEIGAGIGANFAHSAHRQRGRRRRA
ncbi:MAG TPA: hypothetical protein VLB47_16065 [Solirubrobacteraceae bacterium]|nr:hypothetical protein [Solirubrobacteraceae bacterium]